MSFRLRHDKRGQAVTDMKKLILNELLDRYERSKAFREGASARRVLIDAGGWDPYVLILERTDEKKEFHRSLQELRDMRLLDYSWERFEAGNIVEKIWLNTEEKALNESYRIAGVVGKAEIVNRLAELLEAFLEKVPDKSCDIYQFFEAELQKLQLKKTVSRFFFKEENAEEKNKRLLAFFEIISQNKEEILERILSTRLYGESKYFEKTLKGKALSVLREIAKRDCREDFTDQELLEERGVFKWPEILEFCGPISIELDDGRVISCMEQIYGAYINALTVRHIQKIRTEKVRLVTSIENKANYTWYLEHKKSEDELILYHGGCFSPVKGRWFELIAQSLKVQQLSDHSDSSTPGTFQVRVRHWSDVDLGGFRIFTRFRNEVFPNAEPWHMDVQTLKDFKKRCIGLGSTAYRSGLEEKLADPSYSCFKETIQYMLRENVRLEQEAEL